MDATRVVSPTRQSILDLLDELPAESLSVVEALARLLRDQAQRGSPVVVAPDRAGAPPFRYPTVAVPAAKLDGLVGIMPPVGGDALADTEALYAEA